MTRTAERNFDYEYEVHLDGELAGYRSLRRQSSDVVHQRAYRRISPMEVRNYAFGLLDTTGELLPY